MEPSTTAGFSHSMSMDTSVASVGKGMRAPSLVAPAAGIAAVRAAAAAGAARAAGIVVAQQQHQQHEHQDAEQDQDEAAAPEACLARGRPGIAAPEIAAPVLQLERLGHGVALDGAATGPGDLARRLLHRQQLRAAGEVAVEGLLAA